MTNSTEKLYKVSGEKIKSLLIAADAMLFSSQEFETEEAFNKAWGKTLSLATKKEIKYHTIKSVTKEDGAEEIVIKYKGAVGVPAECTFSFTDKNETESFFQLLTGDGAYVRTEERLSPFKASRPYIIGLVIAAAGIIFAHYQAIALQNGTDEGADSRKVRLFNNIIRILGDRGVWIVGGLVLCFIGYKIWSRYTNPPNVTRFTPASAQA